MSTGPGHGEGMSTIVKTVSRWLRGPILLFGIYLVVFGHLTPGGGFSGGVVAAAAFILVLLAEGRASGLKVFPYAAATRLDVVGALAFLCIALLGIALGSAFFFNFIPTAEEARFSLGSGGAIPLSNLAIGIKVGSSLFLVFAVLAMWHAADEEAPGENEEETP